MLSVTNVIQQAPYGRSKLHKGAQVIEQRSVTRISNDTTLNVGDAVRNTAIGGAVGGALAGVAYLAKISLPLLGKVTSLAGIARFAGAGAGIGLAATVLPVVWPKIDRYPALKAALTGAGIGASVGTLLPFVSPVFGAIVGAGIGLAVHFARRNRNYGYYGYCGTGWGSGRPMPPGIGSMPRYIPAPPFTGMPYGYRRPGLLQRIFGSPASSYGNAWAGAGMVGGYPMGMPGGYPMGAPGYYGPSMAGAYGAPYGLGSPYGAGMLGMKRNRPTGGRVPSTRPVPRRRGLSGFGAVTVTKGGASQAATAGMHRASSGKAASRRAAARRAAARRQAAARQAAAQRMGGFGGIAGVTNPAAYLNPALAGMMPFASPFAAGQGFGAGMPGMGFGTGMPGMTLGMAMPQMTSGVVNGMPVTLGPATGPAPTLTGPIDLGVGVPGVDAAAAAAMPTVDVANDPVPELTSVDA